MPDAYETYDARYIQERQATSAANGLNISIGPVPAGVIWTVVAASLIPSVAETQDFWFAVYSSAGNVLPITWPQELAADPALSKLVPLVREGMELKLYPGDTLFGYRDAATAGSSLQIKVRFIESAMPLYRQYEPQLDRAQSARKAGPSTGNTSAAASSPIPRGTFEPSGREGGGGGKRGQPI